jgi:hypothetical protein
MSFISRSEQQQMLEAAALENAKKALVAFVYQKFPTVIVCEASSRMILELMERWAPNVIPSPELFMSMLDENGKDALSMLATQPVERTREQITEEILTLLASKNGGRDGKFDAFNLRSEEKRMASWSLDQLRSRLAEIRNRQRMAPMPVAALKQVVHEAHRDQSQFPGYSNLPPTMWDGSKHVKVDADYLNGLARQDIWAFKRLVRLYGSEQIDFRRGLK